MAIVPIEFREFQGVLFNYGERLYFEERKIGSERAFEADISKGYRLRVLTSISSGKSVVRDEGTDAIRVQVVDSSGDPVIHTSHTKRTQGWDKRLREKLDTLLLCPLCRSSRRIGESEYGSY